jgi:hypothetical protein
MVKRGILLSVLLVFISAGSVFGVFDYCKKLYTTSTKYFDIIYAENSKESALYVASFADDYFEKINALIQNTWKERITVVISDDHDDAQGYAVTVPSYSTITIFDTPAGIDSTVGNVKDFIKLEFLHEMTHVISLNTRNGMLEFMSKIFGNWVYPQGAMPMFMVEGVTVSFESLDGEGRVNHPWIAEYLKQDIVENRFKNPQQASGAYDTYFNRSIFYFYGGYFNHYIQKKYGMDKYRELWHKSGDNIMAAIGSGWSLNGGGSIFDSFFPFIFLGNTFGLGGVFKDVYGVSIETEWDNFKEDLRYKGQLDSNKPLIDGFVSIDSPVLAKGKLFYIDNFNLAVVSYDLKTSSSANLYEGEGMDNIAVSQDGRMMIINRFAYKDRRNGLQKAFAQFYDLNNKSFTGKEIEGYREVNFFNDGLIGIRAKKNYTDLVKIDMNGKAELVLAGTHTLYFSSPRQLNSKEIVFLMNDNGKIKIGKYNFDTKTLQALDAPVKYLKNIGVYDGKIFFSYNNDMTFYKMAALDGKNLTLQTNNVSGGVFFPMMENDKIYYLGSFSKGHQFMVYPEKYSAMTGTKVTANFADFAGAGDANDRIIDYKGKISDYNALPYLLPRAWIPIIGFKGADYLNYNTIYDWVSGNQQFLGLDSAGLLTRLTDPTAMNTIDILAFYNFFYPFANVGMNWQNTALPVHFSVIAADKLKYPFSSVEFPGLFFDLYERDTIGAVDLNYTFNFLSQNQYLRIGTTQSYDINFMSFDLNSVDPYSWPQAQNTYTSKVYFKLAEYTMFHPYRTYNYMRGFVLTGFYAYSIANNMMGIGTEVTDVTNTNNYLMVGDNASASSYYITGGSLEIYPYFLPLLFKVNGAYSSRVILNTINQGYNEFSDQLYSSDYYGAGDFAAELLNFDTQFGLPLWFPVYVNQISWTVGYRDAYLAETYLHSAYTRLTITLPYTYGSYSQLKVNIFGEAYYAINTGNYGFFVGFDIGKQDEEN